MDQSELDFIGNVLLQILGNDNQARQAGEAHLNKIKLESPDKYACYLTAVLNHTTYIEQVKALASVILRRNISFTSIDSQDVQNASNNSNLWSRLTPQTKQFVKAELLKTISECSDKTLLHKICNLIIEVAGTLFDQEKEVWQDLLNLIFVFVNSDDNQKVDAALTMFNGLFGYLMDHLVQYKQDLMGIFSRTLQHNSLDINLAALQAVSNFLQIAEGKDTKGFTDLLPAMVNVIQKAIKEDDETVLEDALIEFNEIAEIEPKFFRRHFKDLFFQLSPIVGKNDFTNMTIRHQPIEFFVTVIERQPSIVKKDQETLKAVLDVIFKLMIDIDADIDESWMRPKEGFKADEEEEEDDAVHFGKTCVDRLVSSIGEELMLPLLNTLVTNTLSNDTDWRFKNAGLMALSQVGEYIDSVDKIAPMVPTILAHFQHPVPKIRYAAIHCIGQISDDMTEEFQDNFHESVLPAIIAMLGDSVPRVQAHACAALTNFLEGTSEEIVQNYISSILPLLSNLIQNGISIIKENAVTSLASLAESAKEHFSPYFSDCLNYMLTILGQYNEPCYKQFKGQVIEAVTIISASVGLETFRPYAQNVISAMLEVQNKQLDSKDPQRSYLLSAWQRICLLMKKDFAPFLSAVVPSLFQMATLNPEMSIQGFEKAGDLVDVLSEIKPVDKSEKQININTDETEEKDVAIQMLTVFIDELGGAFAEYIEPTSKILLSMISYEANDSIRNSTASALPGLIKCYKEAQPQNTQTIVMLGQSYMEAVWKAIKTETETDTLICQVQSIKEIISEVGCLFLTSEVILAVTEQLIEMYNKSDERIKENNEFVEKAEEPNESDEEIDDDEKEIIKEENNNEYDLQLSIAEVIGILFKTHTALCEPTMNLLFSKVLQEAITSSEKQKNKFAVFIMDDMVEFLGPQYLGQQYNVIAGQIIKFCSCPVAGIRQAATYGVGIMAQTAGHAFQAISNDCQQGLKAAIEYPIPANDKGKKKKEKQYYHAKDNAVSALGKIIKYQSQTIDIQNIVPHWIGLLPLKNDLDEAKISNELFATILTDNPVLALGEQYQRFEQIVILLGDILHEKQVDQVTGMKLSLFCQKVSLDNNLGAVFKNLFDNKLNDKAKTRITQALAYKHQ